MTTHIPLTTELMAETIDHDRLGAAGRRPAAARADQPPTDRPSRPRLTRRIVAFLAAVLLFALVAQPGGVRAQDDAPAPAGVTLDADADGLMDEQELQIGTDPTKPDTDVDRLGDGFEVRELGTDPLRADSDEDGLGDGDELEVFKTDPLRVDTDGDGIDDATEIDAGSDPRDPKSVPADGAPKPSPKPSAKPTPPVKGAVATQLPDTGVGAAADDGGSGTKALAIFAAVVAAAALIVRRRLA